MFFHRHRKSWYRRATKALSFSLLLYWCSRWFLRSVSKQRKKKKRKRGRNEPLILKY
ncbi:MAG: hypothetical protein GF331_10975 [Chitinivibrionales bacterium]|nr:hypothetical protein [Chitinivibrionales bacterium]